MRRFLRTFGRGRVPYVPQVQATDCGAACLTMVLQHHGHHAPMSEVSSGLGVSRDGVNALSLVRTAQAYGLAAHGVRLELDDLRSLPTPAILHWEGAHFVVMERARRTTLTVVDPASGRETFTYADAGRRFTGVAVVLQPTPTLAPRPRARTSLRRYWGALRAQAWGVAHVVLASLALQAIAFLMPVANQVVVDRIIVPHQSDWLLAVGVALAAATVAQASVGLARAWVMQGLQYALNVDLMTGFVQHVLRLPLGFFLQRHPGDILQRFQSNVEARNIVSAQAMSAVLDGTLLVSYAALMAGYDASLACVVMAFGAVRVGLLLGTRWTRARLASAELRAGANESSVLVEAFSGIETTKAIGAETAIVRWWTDRASLRVSTASARRMLASGLSSLTTVLQGLSTAAIALVGGDRVVHGAMTVGEYAAFLALQALFLEPLGSLLANVEQFQLLGSHLARLDDVLNTPGERAGSVSVGRLRGRIVASDLSFRYSHSSPEVLRSLSLRIEPGEAIGIVGRCGSGKSTLANVLGGLLSPTTGSVVLDGTDMQRVDAEEVRMQVGFVHQQPFLFDTSVRANLSNGDEAIPLDRIRWAARMACVDDVICALPGGYDTPLGVNGASLSGGERQRLALARALVRDPAILILDEGSSSLDADLERRIQRNLSELGCTRIYIAHRLATVREVDRIYVLQAGALVQVGTYEELSRGAGVFQELLRAHELKSA